MQVTHAIDRFLSATGEPPPGCSKCQNFLTADVQFHLCPVLTAERRRISHPVFFQRGKNAQFLDKLSTKCWPSTMQFSIPLPINRQAI